MNYSTLLKTITWIFIIIALIFFWIGLRSTVDNVQNTLYALAAIAIAWGANYLLKQHEKKAKNE